jgi:UDP-N-acetylmuramoylalanine-D-glutamate ligase
MKPAKPVSVMLVCALLVVPLLAHAHHSYADYIRAERSLFEGKITAIHWANPHVVLTVFDGKQDMRIEWIAAQRAAFNGVSKEQLLVGDSIRVIGSKNRKPELRTMTLIKELEIPAKGWHWVSTSLARSNQ